MCEGITLIKLALVLPTFLFLALPAYAKPGASTANQPEARQRQPLALWKARYTVMEGRLSAGCGIWAMPRRTTLPGSSRGLS